MTKTTSQLEDQFQELFKQLVPADGSSDTLEGEFLRAAGRIRYRFFNDGDWWNEGYGCETAGAAASFLMDQVPGAEGQEITRLLNGVDDQGTVVNKIVDIVTSYVSGKMHEPTPFDGDMFDWAQPDCQDDYEEDDWDTEEEDMYS